ncbi:MAG: SMI1/KNR4 family protein [Oscillospiraceae bacterium]
MDTCYQEKYKTEIDGILQEMRVVLQAARAQQQGKDYYTVMQHYGPVDTLLPVNEKALKLAAARWSLPQDYSYFLSHFLPGRILWSNPHYYMLNLFGAEHLNRWQQGYSVEAGGGAPRKGWPANMLVIALSGGEAYCVDTTLAFSPVYHCCAGAQAFTQHAPTLVDFLKSVVEQGHPNIPETE